MEIAWLYLADGSLTVITGGPYTWYEESTFQGWFCLEYEQWE